MSINTQDYAERLRDAGFEKTGENTGDIFDEFDRLKDNGDQNIWEAPIPFASTSLPVFPVNELPVVINDMVRAVAETTQTAPDMAAVSSLSILAVCTQGKFIIEGKPDWTQQLNLFSAVVTKPSELKSAVLSLMTVSFKSFESDYNKKIAPLIEQNKIEKAVLLNRKKILETKAAKSKNENTYAEIRELSEEISNFKDIKPCRLYCDDITPERLAGVMSENNGRAAIISSEGGIFDILAGRYSESANIDTFLKAHEGDTVRVDRQVRGKESADTTALTALIFTQPAVLENMMANPVFKGRGLCARFLYSLPMSRVGSRKFKSVPIPEVTKERYNKLIHTLLSFDCETPGVIKLSEKAAEVFEEFYEKIEPMLIEELADIADWAGKFRGAVLRIAGLLYIAEQLPLSENDELILPESFMRSAIKIGEYFLEHAKAAYQLMGSSDENLKNAEYVLSKIVSNKLDVFKKLDLLRLCRKFKSVDQLTEPLNILVKRNYLREVAHEYTGVGRKPENSYRVNPHIL